MPGFTSIVVVWGMRVCRSAQRKPQPVLLDGMGPHMPACSGRPRSGPDEWATIQSRAIARQLANAMRGGQLGPWLCSDYRKHVQVVGSPR